MVAGKENEGVENVKKKKGGEKGPEKHSRDRQIERVKILDKVLGRQQDEQ